MTNIDQRSPMRCITTRLGQSGRSTSMGTTDAAGVAASVAVAPAVVAAAVAVAVALAVGFAVSRVLVSVVHACSSSPRGAVSPPVLRRPDPVPLK